MIVKVLPSVLWCCWLGGRKGIRPVKKWVVGVLVWLSVCSELQTCIRPSSCYCHSPSLASVKSRLVLPFWYRLTRAVQDKGLLNWCVCVIVKVVCVLLQNVSENNQNVFKTACCFIRILNRRNVFAMLRWQMIVQTAVTMHENIFLRKIICRPLFKKFSQIWVCHSA